MIKTDIHVLNWDLITKSIYRNNKEKNKGILFEDLIEKLISAMFPNEIWHRTSLSYDGKKDFVYPADEFLPEEKWAECKNYKDNLSINVISPTLIMSSIDNIEQIYFFSYSQLNDNAIDGILRFSKSSKKKVTVFDGNLLESLICKYHNINGIKDFFPNTDFKTAYSILRKKKFRIINYLKDTNGHSISSKHIFQLGESFNLSIIVQNLSLEDDNYKLEIEGNKGNILISNKTVAENSISFAEIKENIVFCQSLKSGDLTFSFKITSKNNYNQKNKQTTIKRKIKVSDEPYLFWSGERAFSTLEKCKNHLINYNKKPLIICSKSGAGKSTLLSILSNEKNIQDTYSIINLDLELSRNYGVKNLFCQAINIFEFDETPIEQIDDQNRVLSVLLDDYAKSASMIAKNIMKLYNWKKPFLFIIDDIQRINRPYIELISELNYLSLNEGKQIYYVFALNNELLSLDNLLVRLNWDKYYGNNEYEYAELFYFNKSDILAFLKHKLGLTEIDDYFENFEKEISPLEMQGFSTDLINKNIITLIPMTSVYQVVDKIKFAENVEKILYSNYSINALCSAFEGSDIPEYILKYLCINTELLLSKRNSYSIAINQLIDSKIIKEVKGKVLFYHDIIKNTLKKKITYTEEDYVDIFYDENISLEGKAICAIKQMDRIFQAPKFLKKFFEKNEEIKKPDQLYEICWFIFENLEKFKKYDLTSTALNFVYNNLKKLSFEQSQSKYYELMSYILKVVKSSCWDIDEECVEFIAYFIKKYFDRMLSTYNHQNCYNEYLDVCNMLLSSNNMSDKRKNFWLSHYSNRAAISLDRNSDPFEDEPKEVKELYNLSEDYYKKSTHNNDLLLQICVDNFNRKYVYHHNLTIEHIQFSYNKLVELDERFIERKVCLRFHLLLLKYLEMIFNNSHNEQELKQFISKVIKLRMESKSSFYNLKLYMLEIYILMDLKNYSQADVVLDESLRFAYVRGMRIAIYKLTYIKSFLLKFIDDGNEEIQQTKMILAFEQFMNTKGTSKNSINRESYIVFELLSAINSFAPEYFKNFLKHHNNPPYELLKKINEKSKENLLYRNNNSYFIYEGINFPLI